MLVLLLILLLVVGLLLVITVTFLELSTLPTLELLTILEVVTTSSFFLSNDNTININIIDIINIVFLFMVRI